MRTRSCRSATRRRGLPQGRGSAPRRTRAVSACPTRTTGLARCRQRALPPSVSQCQLDRTACDQCGTRGVDRARWGGAGLPRGAPGRSRRAQGARHALPEASSMPYPPRRIAMQARPHRWNATRQPGGAGRCGTVVMGDRVWWRPPSKARKSCTGCTSALCYGVTHGTEARACWRKTSGRRDIHRPWSTFLIATEAAASPTGARTARRRRRPERPRARACCWHVLRGG